MAKSNRIHVTNRGGGEWAALREGAARASTIKGTQAAATRWATRHAKAEGGQVLIHRQGGLIREERSFGNDPYPPRG